MGIKRIAMRLDAAFLLALSALMIAVLPFASLVRLLKTAAGSRPTRKPASAELAEEIRWAVQGTAKRIPVRLVCFQQGLAAFLMLRKRGLQADFYYGAARDDTSSLSAHVWVQSGSVEVIGCEEKAKFAVLMHVSSSR